MFSTKSLFTAILGVHIVTALQTQQPLSPPLDDPYGPNIESAKQNANLIFNAIHSSMRQWGSSLQHNGMSFFPAYVPNGTLLYHGDPSIEKPPGREWLAFEWEHGELFSLAHGNAKSARASIVTEGFLPRNKVSADMVGEILPGYLQIYKANRPLDRLLYIDGMSAGNSDFGPLDSQDMILLNTSRAPLEDFERAQDLCDLGVEWGIEAYIRMEAGFEMIKCNFSDGLDYLSHRKKQAWGEEMYTFTLRYFFEYMRGVESRHHSIGAGRVVLDYSSMVSAYFYPANISNPNPESRNIDSSLPRLINSQPAQWNRIKSDLRDVMSRERSFDDSINWQGVVDMIVMRYSTRLQFIASTQSRKDVMYTVNIILNMFIDFGAKHISLDDSVEACSSHFLQAVTPSTEQDHLISAAIEAVNRRICMTLFEIREDLVSNKAEDDDSVDSSTTQKIKDLKEWLNWTTWKECGKCKADEVCYVAAWPWGYHEDHYNPRCMNWTETSRRGLQTEGFGYWFPEGRTWG